MVQMSDGYFPLIYILCVMNKAWEMFSLTNTNCTRSKSPATPPALLGLNKSIWMITSNFQIVLIETCATWQKSSCLDHRSPDVFFVFMRPLRKHHIHATRDHTGAQHGLSRYFTSHASTSFSFTNSQTYQLASPSIISDRSKSFFQ